MNTIYDVSGKRELMIDDFLISKMRNVSFLQHTPVELPCDKNKPLGHYNSIVRNPDGTFFYYDRYKVFRGPGISYGYSSAFFPVRERDHTTLTGSMVPSRTG